MLKRDQFGSVCCLRNSSTSGISLCVERDTTAAAWGCRWLARRLAAREGRPQAELIREGVRKVIADIEAQPRTFRSLAAGRGGGSRPAGWTSDELYRKALGRP